MTSHSIFRYSPCDFLLKVPRLECQHTSNLLPISSLIAGPDGENRSGFDSFLQTKWNEAKFKGLFRYDLDALKSRILPGKYNFVAQLNTKRATERRKPQTITNLLQPFNPNIFNFTKANYEEILFSFERKQVDSAKEENNLVLINVSPLEFCNSLLVPNADKYLPQVLDEDGLHKATELVLLSSTAALRVGFNSLCGYASVNHYHFHLFYLNHPLYLETVTVKHVVQDCFEVSDYAVAGFVFILENGDIGKLVKSVLEVVSVLIVNNIPHNLFITRGAKANEFDSKVHNAVRVFLWPRKPCDDDKDKGAFNVACCEISGHLPIKDEVSFYSVTEAEVVKALSDTCLAAFNVIRPKVIEHLNLSVRCKPVDSD